MEWYLFSEPQTLVQEVKNAISGRGKVAVIHHLALINSPVFWGQRDGLGFDAPEDLKAGSGRPLRGLSLPAFTSRHRGKVRRQGPPLAGWGQPPCGGISRQGEGLMGWWMACF